MKGKKEWKKGEMSNTKKIKNKTGIALMGGEKRLILQPGGPSKTFTEHISYEEKN